MTKWDLLRHEITGAEHSVADNDAPGMLRKLNAACILIARMVQAVPADQLGSYLAALKAVGAAPDESATGGGHLFGG